MTNTNIIRDNVISESEFDESLDTVDTIPRGDDYYYLRDKAIISIFWKTGKRRGEVAQLKKSDVEVNKKNKNILDITFSLEKTRAKNPSTYSNRRTMSLEVDYVVQHIMDYWNMMNTQYSECEYMFPHTHWSPIHNTLVIEESLTRGKRPSPHLSGRQILRIVKLANPQSWCHLYRETMGAKVVREDPSIIAAFRVMERLHLKDYRTGFHYMERYAKSVIKAQKQRGVT